MSSPKRKCSGTDRELPLPCPQCGVELENKDDAIVHMVKHA